MNSSFRGLRTFTSLSELRFKKSVSSHGGSLSELNRAELNPSHCGRAVIPHGLHTRVSVNAGTRICFFSFLVALRIITEVK